MVSVTQFTRVRDYSGRYPCGTTTQRAVTVSSQYVAYDQQVASNDR